MLSKSVGVVVVLFSLFFLFDSSNGESYSLDMVCYGGKFLDCFDFTTWSKGCSESVDKDTAISLGMINTTQYQTYIGAETNNVYNKNGKCRQVVQIISKFHYDRGLFVLNAQHMPYGCGVWPAFWTMGPATDWPYYGEIDIIEGINMADNTQSTLHTSNNCDFSSVSSQIQSEISGSVTNTFNCSFMPGCAEYSNDHDTYGDSFDSSGGGVWAMELTDDFIKMFYFNHNDIPSDLTNEKPDPTTWGKPWAYFPFGSWCSNDHFKEQYVYIDTYMCGWAAETDTTYPFSWSRQCESKYGNSCESFVSNNPNYFEIAYWLINSLEVYVLS